MPCRTIPTIHGIDLASNERTNETKRTNSLLNSYNTMQRNTCYGTKKEIRNDAFRPMLSHCCRCCCCYCCDYCSNFFPFHPALCNIPSFRGITDEILIALVVLTNVVIVVLLAQNQLNSTHARVNETTEMVKIPDRLDYRKIELHVT
mmetsp:Transcript_12653/g.26670  ORF Transcript_12653/g.26670 Transcript_12653/m.26670 type:complete len:147 (+) Transcript_12653:263-703(+)